MIDRVRPGTGHDDDLACDRREVGAKMHRALEHQRGMIGGLDAEMTEHGLIRRLHALRGDHDRQTTNLQRRHRPEPHPRADEHRPRGFEVAVAEGDHLGLADKRYLAFPGASGTELDPDDAAEACSVGLGRRLRVVEQS